MKKVYLDYAATTPVSDEVLKAMMPYFNQNFGNASELHTWGIEAKKGMEEAREKIAQAIGASREEIIFTSCATESINLSHKGLIEMVNGQWLMVDKKPHIITTQIEHKAVLETCKHLEKMGWAQVTYLPVDELGLIKVEDVEKAIKSETVLVSIMYVNNEVGTIQPISEIGRLIRFINHKSSIINHSQIYFHTDATQGVQYLDCDVNCLQIDFLSMTGHKLYAPKGIGALYVRKGTKIIRQQDGGGQEHGFRAGTENIPYIVGLGEAVDISAKCKVQSAKLVGELRDKLIAGVLKIAGTKLTGHPTIRAPHIASFLVEGVEGESLQLLLNEAGIACSTGSACTTGDLAPSHVLTAMGIIPEKSHGSLRFSLGKDTTEEDIEYVLEVLPEIIDKIRKIAPKLN
jgi:cysteine desulfurase